MQRAGKSHKASGADDPRAMQTYSFFKECRKVLTEYGHDDAAFYFEQVEEHLRNGGSLASKDVGRILGV